MKIRRLSLENYKSYKNATINFDEGINCILGKNGAGKSTIIEAIGATMFNYDIRKSQFQIRYGEKSAKIELEYEGKDGTVYIITKKIGNNSSVKIRNLNTNELIENASNVYTYVKESLGIKQERSLSEMYREIIAVPQGEFVSIFLETETERKKKFDNLFNLDIYNDIWKKLGEIESLNKDNVSAVEKDKKYLDGQVADVDKVRSDVKEKRNAIKSTNKIIEDTNIQIGKLDKDVKEQSDIKKELDGSEKRINKLENDIKILDAELSTLNESLKDISNSVEIIKNNEENYTKYNSYLEKEKEQDKRITEFNEKNTLLIGEESNLKILEERKRSNNNTINQNNFKIGDAEKQSASLIGTIIGMENNLKEEKDAMNSFADSVKSFEEKVNNDKQSLKNIDDNYFKMGLEYQNVSNYKDIDIKKLENAIKNTDNAKQVKADLEEKIKKVTDQLSLSKATKLNIENNMTSLQEGRCPIFNNACSNLGDNNLITLLADETKKINDLNKECESLSKELKKYEGLDVQYFKLNDQSEKYQEYLKVSEKIKNEIRDTGLLEIDNTDVSDLLRKIKGIRDKKEEQIALKENELSEMKEKLNTMSKSIINKEAELRGKRSELDGKGNDITSFKNAISDAEKDNVGVQKEIDDCQGRIKEIKGKIKKLKDCKDLKDYYVNLQNTVKDSYDLYVRNIGNASKYEEKKEQLNDKSNARNKLCDKLKDEQDAYNDIKKQFNADEYENNVKLLGTLQGEVKKNEALLEEYNNQYDEASSKLKEKEKILEDINKKILLINKYNKVTDYIVNVRNIMRNLPKELSKRYRESISQMSTIFYQKISKENVSIELDETYRVLVIDSEKKSNKKEMSQLSGGEQMSLAISIRISMLKYFAGIDMYFLDEPTVNLDADRRFEIADVIKDYSKELRQLFVISHDDTFESITTNILKIEKINNESELD